MIGELKSVNTYQFKKMIRHPSAYKQLQWYMFLSGIRKGFVLADDKNTQDFKVEVYDYDPTIVAPFIDRAEEIKLRYNKLMKTGKMVKRPSNLSQSCKKCEECSMRDVCYHKIKGIKL